MTLLSSESKANVQNPDALALERCCSPFSVQWWFVCPATLSLAQALPCHVQYSCLICCFSSPPQRTACARGTHSSWDTQSPPVSSCISSLCYCVDVCWPGDLNSWARGFAILEGNFDCYRESRSIEGNNLVRGSCKICICHPAAKIPCQLGGGSVVFKFSLHTNRMTWLLPLYPWTKENADDLNSCSANW